MNHRSGPIRHAKAEILGESLHFTCGRYIGASALLAMQGPNNKIKPESLAELIRGGNRHSPADVERATDAMVAIMKLVLQDAAKEATLISANRLVWESRPVAQLRKDIRAVFGVTAQHVVRNDPPNTGMTIFKGGVSLKPEAPPFYVVQTCTGDDWRTLRVINGATDNLSQVMTEVNAFSYTEREQATEYIRLKTEDSQVLNTTLMHANRYTIPDANTLQAVFMLNCYGENSRALDPYKYELSQYLPKVGNYPE